MRKLILMAVASFLWKKYSANRTPTNRNASAGNMTDLNRGRS